MLHTESEIQQGSTSLLGTLVRRFRCVHLQLRFRPQEEESRLRRGARRQTHSQLEALPATSPGLQRQDAQINDSPGSHTCIEAKSLN